MKSKKSTKRTGRPPSPPAARSGSCTHRYTYYCEEHDNWYCAACHKGMGQDYYNQNRKHILVRPNKELSGGGEKKGP